MPGFTAEVRLYLPHDVADWYRLKAAQTYKSRATYLRDLLIANYRKANP
jgi:hypothetical protein